MDLYGNNLVTLLNMITMTRGCSVLNVKVGCQRSRSFLICIVITLQMPLRMNSFVHVHQTWHTYYP